MNKKTIESKKEQRLSKLISSELGLSFASIQKLIRSRDIKINGVRVGKDVTVCVGDEIEIYYPEMAIDVIFENDDIVVVNKPRNIETVSDSQDDVLEILNKQLGEQLFAVHRLDRNTQGLVIFAKNLDAKQALDEAIKNRNIKKYYLAKVVGIPKIKNQNLLAYLKKDEKNSVVYVSDNKFDGYDEIKTHYRVLESDEEFSVLEVELVTGKTHQIRAHLSHIGLPILGDEKYGNNLVNKKMNKKQQCLCAYKLVFDLESGYLSYLNGSVLELQKNKIKL